MGTPQWIIFIVLKDSSKYYGTTRNLVWVVPHPNTIINILVPRPVEMDLIDFFVECWLGEAYNGLNKA